MCVCVCVCVCVYNVFCYHAQQAVQRASPTSSALHWLDFKTGNFRKSTVFKSYSERKSQYDNKFELTASRFRALSKHGNDLKENWWQRQRTSKQRENRQLQVKDFRSRVRFLWAVYIRACGSLNAHYSSGSTLVHAFALLMYMYTCMLYLWLLYSPRDCTLVLIIHLAIVFFSSIMYFSNPALLHPEMHWTAQLQLWSLVHSTLKHSLMQLVTFLI